MVLKRWGGGGVVLKQEVSRAKDGVGGTPPAPFPLKNLAHLKNIFSNF